MTDDSLKAPAGLKAAGRDAFDRAINAVEEPGRYYDAAVVYAEAVDRHAEIVGFWKSEGCPIVALGGATGKVEQAHPLLAAMNEAEKSIRQAAQVLGMDPASRNKLGSRGTGRPAGTALPAHMPERPSDRLKLVS